MVIINYLEMLNWLYYIFSGVLLGVVVWDILLDFRGDMFSILKDMRFWFVFLDTVGFDCFFNCNWVIVVAVLFSFCFSFWIVLLLMRFIVGFFDFFLNWIGFFLIINFVLFVFFIFLVFFFSWFVKVVIFCLNL